MDQGVNNGLVVDHIDGDTFNNCISNLRVVSHRENMNNLKCHRRNNA